MERELEAPRQELRALRNEIAALERRLEQPHHAAVAPEPESEPNRLFSQENYEPGRELQTQLGHLESGLSFLSKLTGFRMTDYSMTRLELPASARKTQKNELRVLRKGHLAGSCYTVNFQLEFELLEVQAEESSSAAVRDLRVAVEPAECTELNKLVSRTEEKRDLFLFFRSLHFFLEWCECRKRTFKYFKEKHPAVVQLPGGPAADTMGLRSPQAPGFELLLVWLVRITDEGKVVPELDLLPKLPARALSLDAQKVAERAARCFRTLVGLLGVEAAIESVIGRFCAQE